MRTLAVLLAAVLSLTPHLSLGAASAQQTSSATSETTRMLERPSDAALEAFMEQQRKAAPGWIDRFDGPIGENLKIHTAVSRNSTSLTNVMGGSWVPGGKAVTLDVSVKLAKGGIARIKTATIRPNSYSVTPEQFGVDPPYAHATFDADVRRDHIIEADVLATIDGVSVLLENVRLRSGEARDVKAPNGDVFTVTATVRDMSERERAAEERLRSDSVARTVKQRNDWDAANPGKPFQYPTGGSRRPTPEEMEARRRPLSAEEDALLSGAPSDVPDGFVVEVSETLTFAGGEELPSLKGFGFDDQFQVDMVRLPSGKKYTSSTRYRASRDGNIQVQKILMLDGVTLAKPDLTVRSGESARVTVDGLEYKAVFTLRRMTSIEKTAYEGYTLANKRLPDPDMLPPGTEPRPWPSGMSRAMPSVEPLVSADGKPVSRLLARISDEEQDKQMKEEMEEFRANPPQGMSKAEVEDMLRNPPVPSKLQRARMVMFEYSHQLSQNIPARVLPEGKLLETSVWVQLPGGDKIGPFRMYNSSAGSMDSLEAADGMFGSDGNERFVGTMLGTASADETVEMTFMLVIDRQPVMVSGVRARSGQATAYTTQGGYRLIVRPVLRAPTWQEQRNIDQRKSAHIHQSIATRLSGPPEPPPVASSSPAPVP
jgi:hypothetical protein